jgi:hypothetical protein
VIAPTWYEVLDHFDIAECVGNEKSKSKCFLKKKHQKNTFFWSSVLYSRVYYRNDLKLHTTWGLSPHLAYVMGVFRNTSNWLNESTEVDVFLNKCCANVVESGVLTLWCELDDKMYISYIQTPHEDKYEINIHNERHTRTHWSQVVDFRSSKKVFSSLGCWVLTIWCELDDKMYISYSQTPHEDKYEINIHNERHTRTHWSQVVDFRSSPPFVPLPPYTGIAQW